jgi:uncharacterized protein (TIGR02996 family)
MTSEDKFLATILAAPDDDLPRMVYADWLDENAGTVPCRYCKEATFDTGDYGGPLMNPKIVAHLREKCPCGGSGEVSNGYAERAEFIRVQCELAVTPEFEFVTATVDKLGNVLDSGGSVRNQQYDTIRKRERELLVDFPAAPYWGVPDCLRDSHPHRDIPQGRPAIRCFGSGVKEVVLEFRRGFIESVTCDLATFLGICRRCSNPLVDDCRNCGNTGRTISIAPALFASQPVTRVTITDAAVYQSGGNDPYYLGGLGRFPQEYWRQLENLPSRKAVLDALSAVCIDHGRAAAKTLSEIPSDQPN